MSNSYSIFLTKKRKLNLIILLGICLSVIYLMYSDLQKPGIFYDDSGHPVVALQMLKNDSIPKYWGHSQVLLFNHYLPVYGGYEGPMSSYLLLPFISLFGPTMAAIRIFGIVVVVCTILVTYLLTREIFDERIALLSSALFALTPSVIFLGKIPTAVNFIMLFYTIITIYFLYKWKNSRQIRFLVFGFFTLGLGISTKITFWWIPLALLIAFVIFRPRLGLNPKRLIFASMFLVSGSILFLSAFIANYDWYLGYFIGRLNSTPTGAHNTTFLSNLQERLSNFIQLSSTSDFQWLGGTHENLLFPIFFLISAVGIIIMKIMKYDACVKKPIFFIFITTFILIISTVTVSTRNSWQLLIIFPFVQIIMSVFIIQFFDKIKKSLKNNIPAYAFLILVVLFLMLSNISIINQYKEDLKRTDGTGYFSIQFNHLADYLLNNNMTNVVALDWGFTREIYYLTDGKIIPQDNAVYPGGNFSVFDKNLETFMKDPNIVYLKYFKDSPINGSTNHLKNIVEKNNKNLILVRTFKDWDGTDLFYIYKIE